MTLLTGKIISCCKVITIKITQEVIDIVEALSKKYGIKYLLKLKDHKERIFSRIIMKMMTLISQWQ